ncbi:MAG: cardiolipin synthase, partial [Patescibacteria group bacterium]|nr:cardiolipin synthase [Patescibacteria group bacterium]
SGPGFEAENNLKFFVSLMYNAKNKIILTSPYFVPDESMLTAVTTAAQRGLKVELYVSEVGDQMMVYHAQRSYYEALLRAGVKIYLYKSPYVLHSKHFTVDDDVAVVGSSNMDMRSFNLNMEISLLVYSKDFVKTMRRIEKQYKDDSLELTLDVWMKRPRHEKFVDNALRLTSALQ